MLCVDIMRQRGDITEDEWNFFLRGSTGVDRVGSTLVQPAIFVVHALYTSNTDAFIPTIEALRAPVNHCVLSLPYCAMYYPGVDCRSVLRNLMYPGSV